MSAVITPFEGTELFNTTSFNNRISQINTGFSYVSNPNLLDNWYFGRPVNQRGETEYVGSRYGIDRWRSADATVLLKDGYIRVTRDSGNFWYARLMEYLDTDFSSEIAGKTCTISALVKSVSGSGQVQLSIFNITDDTSTTNIYQGLTGDLDLITTSFLVPDSYAGKRLGLFFYPDTMDSNRSNGCDVYAIKLELGSTQTLAHREGDKWILNEIPDYGEQLRRCQRYCYRLSSHAYGWTYNNRVANCLIPLPVTLRTTPVITLNDSGTINTAKGDASMTSYEVKSVTPNGLIIDLYNSANALTTGTPVVWHNFSMTISADL